MPLSIEAEDRYWREQAELDDTPLTPVKREPCPTCPWRLAFATGATANPRFADVPGLVARLWEGNRSEDEDGGMVDGLLAFCHRNTAGEVHPAVAVPEFDEYSPCVSALAIQQRECVRWHEGEPSGFDQDAAARTAARMGVPPRLFLSRLMTRDDLISRAHPAINDPRIGHPALAPMRPGEFAFEPLLLFDICVGRALSDIERERIERVPGFGVQAAGDTVRVLASSEKVAAVWLGELLGLVPAAV